MQPPTCRGIRIRSVEDAEKILHAVSLELLPMVVSRLDDEERLALTSGCVYVWEQRSSNPLEATGQEIQRFTEGRSWGPSRAREDFLLYYEKESTNRSSILHRNRLTSAPQLIKQTYSAYVDSPYNTRKWHLNAYYTQDTWEQLQTVDDIHNLRTLKVPPGLYVCARSSSSRRNGRNRGGSGDHSVPPHTSSSSSPSSSTPTTQPSYIPPPAIHVRNTAVAPLPASAQFVQRPQLTYQHPSRQLAPLEYLTSIAPRPRDPRDDEALRAFRPDSL